MVFNHEHQQGAFHEAKSKSINPFDNSVNPVSVLTLYDVGIPLEELIYWVDTTDRQYKFNLYICEKNMNPSTK